MKPTVLIVAALCAGLIGLLLLGVFTYFRVTPQQQPRVPARSQVAAAPVDRSGEFEALEAQLAMLSHRLAELEQQVAESARVSARRSVEPQQATHAQTARTETGAGLGFSAADRETVVAILASVRAEEQQQRDEAQLAREEERAALRAAQIAKELGLSLADEVALGDHLVEASLKRGELMAQMREEGFDRTTAGESFTELREWHNEQLQTLFGANLAGQIGQLEGGNRGGTRGPGGRGSITTGTSQRRPR